MMRKAQGKSSSIIAALRPRYFSTLSLQGRNVLISNSMGEALPSNAIDYLRKQGASVDVMERNVDPATRHNELFDKMKNGSFDALYVCLEDKVDAEMITASPSLKVISTMSVGYNHIAIDKCKELSIRVGYTPEVLTETTADLVLALTLATSRMLIKASQAVYNGEWSSWTPLWMAGKDVWGSTVGIVGMGRIGIAAAKRFKGFGCDILYCNASGKENMTAKELGAKFVSFDQLLEGSDFVVPLCPLTPETNQLFKDREFEKMKRDAIFINASRGAVVCEESLVCALNNDTILAAGLDVTAVEPLSMDSPLMKVDQSKLTILPHIGSGSVSTRKTMAMVGAQNIENALTNKPLVYSVC